MDNGPHILVVDDDREIRQLLGRYLQEQGFRVMLAANGRQFTEHFGAHSFDLVVLDVMLPDASGLDLCRDLRGHSRVPIILLTALKEDVDRIIGLEVGADDYLGKPFNPRELAARIRAVLRRSHETQTDVPAGRSYSFPGFKVERTQRRVQTESGNDVFLTSAEFDLLLAFLERPGRLLTRDQLLDITQGRSVGPYDRSIDVLVSRVRRKLGDGGAFQLLKTQRNGGYQFTAPVRVQDTHG